jgi:hypothetical protein
MFEEGNCFWIETNLDREEKWQGHFFVIILKCDDERIIIVNIDKIRGKKKYDHTTIIHAGEGHEFITEDSYVNYDLSELTDIGRINTLLEQKLAKPKGEMNITIVHRICDGVLKSDFTPYEVREVFEDRLYNSIRPRGG